MAPKININIDVVMKLPLKKRVGILVGINVVLFFLIFWFLTMPVYSELSASKSKLVELNDKLIKDRRIASDIPKYLREKKDMEDALILALTQLPNEKEIPDLFDSLANSALRSGLKIQHFKPGKETPIGFYAEVPMSMKVESRFEGLYDYLKKVSELPRIVNLNKMTITSNGHKGREPQLVIEMDATTYRFIAQPEAPPAAAGAEGDKSKGEVKK